MSQAASNSVPRDIIQGVAIISLIFLVAVILPLIGLVLVLALPLPVFYYRAKLGRKNGLIIPVAAAGIMTLVIGSVSPDLMVLTGLLALGFVLCELVEKGLTIEQVILFSGGTVLAAGILGLMIYSSAVGVHPATLLSDYVRTNLELTLSIYKDMGMPEENVRMINQSMDTIRYYLVRILPALCAAFILVEAWLTFLGARFVFNKKGIGFPDAGVLNQWRAPELLVWGVIGSGVMLLLPSSVTRLVGINLMIVLMTIYFFQGIAIVAFYFDKKNLPLALRIFFYIMIIIWHLLLLMVISLGFFDTWADFRKLKTTTTTGSDDMSGDE